MWLLTSTPKMPFCRATLCPVVSRSVFVTNITPKYRTQHFPLLNFMLLMVVCYSCYKDFSVLSLNSYMLLKFPPYYEFRTKFLVLQCKRIYIWGYVVYVSIPDVHMQFLWCFFGCLSGGKPSDNGAPCSAVQPFFVCTKWCARCLIRLHIRCSCSVWYIKQRRSCDSSIVNNYCSSSKVS